MVQRLLPCPCCNNNISTNTTQCPHCGGRNPLAVAGSFTPALTQAELEQIIMLKKQGNLPAFQFLRTIIDCGAYEAGIYVEGLI